MSTIKNIDGVLPENITKFSGVPIGNWDNIDGVSPPATSSIVTTNLVQHLDAGDSNSYPGSGTTWYDLTANNIDYTLINSPTYSSTDGGGSFQFDGVDDSAESTYSASGPILFSPADLDGDGATFQFWAKVVSGEQIQFNNNGASSIYYWGIEPIMQSNANGQRLAAHIFRGINNNSPASRRTAVTSYGIYNANTWYMFTFTFSSNEASGMGFHVNETSHSIAATSGTGPDTSPVYSSANKPRMGKVRNVAREGYVSQVLIYDKVLSSSEISQNFNATKTRYGYS